MAGFFYGVVEGFYGRQWPWQARWDYAAFLASRGFDCYIYAPKGDSALRSAWREPWPEEEVERLVQLADHYRGQGVRFGLGISPLGLVEDESRASIEALKRRIETLNHIGADPLCILFDDMPGDQPRLASRQLEIVEQVLSLSQAQQHIVCPSYYSFDPVLEEVFGPMPRAYLEELGKGLPAGVDIFWTGNKVISESYSEQDLARAAELLQRRPVLWDNYPVNDGRSTAAYLNLRPYSGRPRALSRWARGHCVNPMNQPALSALVLISLAELYSSAQPYSEERAARQALESISNTELRLVLAEDMELFQETGREQLSPERLAACIERYSVFSEPLACEVVDWLQGGYAFDPACLTG